MLPIAGEFQISSKAPKKKKDKFFAPICLTDFLELL